MNYYKDNLSKLYKLGQAEFYIKSNGGLVNTSLGNEIRWAYKLTKKQNLSFRLAYLQSFIKSGINNGDFRGDIRYNISI